MTQRKTGRPVGRKTVTKSNGRQTVTQSTKDARGHLVGSRKGEVHATFDKSGEDAASKLGIKLKLAPGTLRSWFGTWRRAAGTKKAPAKKATPKKPASKKANAKASATA